MHHDVRETHLRRGGAIGVLVRWHCLSGGDQIWQIESCPIALRLIARRTWRFFETFVTAADRWLPPDNVQLLPVLTIAHRTSPTNIGLYLLSTIAARDFGWLGCLDMLARLEATLQAGLAKLDLVTREEFEVQRAVLLRTREKLDELQQIVHEAFYIAASGRPGPVLIDIPKDVSAELASLEMPSIMSPSEAMT